MELALRNMLLREKTAWTYYSKLKILCQSQGMIFIVYIDKNKKIDIVREIQIVGRVE